MTVPKELLPLAAPRAEPAPLQGTAGQINYASSVRRSMLAVARQYGPPELVNLLLCVGDATWFLGNKGRPLGQIRWPSPSQLDVVPREDEAIC